MAFVAEFVHDVVAAILVRDGRVLLCHRHPDRRWYPDVWDTPGGHVDAEEGPVDALVREMREELGIEIVVDTAEPFATFHDGSETRMRFWVIERWLGDVTNRAPDEHDDVAWFEASDLDRLELADPRMPSILREAMDATDRDTELGRPDEEQPGLRRIRAILKWSGEHDFSTGCPLSAALSTAASRDEAIAGVLLDAPATQQRASMLLAAVHDLVLAGADHHLRDYFPTVDPNHRPVDSHLPAVLGDFVRRFDRELRHTVGTRTVQTNEVGRATAVRLAMAAIGIGRDESGLDLVEVGSAAGLLLAFDRYTHRVGDRRLDPEVQPPDELILEPGLLGGVVPDSWPTAPPTIDRRVGIDLHPLDIEDAADRRWLHACVWPSQGRRHTQLDQAIAVTRSVGVTMTSGDAADIGALLTSMSSDRPLVVVSSWTLAYLGDDARRDVVEQLRELSGDRPITLVCLEGDRIVPGIDGYSGPTGRLPIVISTSTFTNGERDDRVIGAIGTLGDWISLNPA